MPLFDRIIMVDWSAAAVPTLGRDSIWISVAEGGQLAGEPRNIATRAAAMDALRDLCPQDLRVLIGFDFAFGYPDGTALRFGNHGWRSVWEWIAANLTDGETNANDRFACARAFNDMFGSGEGPLWGRPTNASVGPGPRKPERMPNGLAERRYVERIVRSAQPVWKLAYPGSVGSQTLTGIARLQAWRSASSVGQDSAVWPFETEFADDLCRQVVLAEIYPSLFDIDADAGETKDAAQVRTLATGYSRLDQQGELLPHLAGPSDVAARRIALREEGWIMSVGDAPLRLAA